MAINDTDTSDSSNIDVDTEANAPEPLNNPQPLLTSLEDNKEVNSITETEKSVITIEPEEEEAGAQPQPAPNVDLSEVAPIPQPIPTTEDNSASFDTDAVTTSVEGTETTAPTSIQSEPVVTQQPKPEPPVTTTAEITYDQFVILGAEVLPGTSTRLAWSPNVAITGLALPTPVLVINGAQDGPTLCLSAAVHGDELNGIEIVRRVMYNIDPSRLHGKVIGVPIVNLQGFQRGSRYLPDRRDLNRFFPGDKNGSLASRIAASFFTEVISHCDMLVDLHTGSAGRTNMPQIRADMSNEAVRMLTEGFDKMVVVHSPGNPGMLRSAANAVGITSVTMEVGESLRVQEDSIKAGVTGVYSLMEKQGMFARRFVWGSPSPVYYKSYWLRTETGGILFSRADLGDTVYAGQVLGHVTDPITNETTQIIAPVKGRIIGMAVNQVVMPGFAAYHIGEIATEDTIVDPETTIDSPMHLGESNNNSAIDTEENFIINN
ncbi:hypothetical protein GCM10007877_24400 [Marinibactrum halimedae]|uniref:Succinylglutamate desuccinylase/Aspartoacylase catalytic domain-containing protein n=2 Tax=Marinibactrum halimedae TaxID=1444977 RepID=A0AA37T448_9GAMM|nr:hypothetical protein GCM10007877_24400 [Marinibactrum halimedae]